MNKNHLLRILMFSLPLMIILAVIVLLIQNKEPATVDNSTTSPSMLSPTPTPASFKPSIWANDDEVLSLESDFAQTEQELSKIDLKKTQILPPVLDMNIKF